MTVVSPRDPGVATASVPLRSFTHPRSSRIEVVQGEADLVLPAYYGRRHRFRVPLAGLSVVNLDGAGPSALAPGLWDDSTVRVPYFNTRGQLGRPNLLLLFAERQRVPRFGWRALAGFPPSLGLKRREVNAPQGVLIDGIALQARDPARAVTALVTAGAREERDPNAWIAAHRLGQHGRQERERAAQKAELAYLAIRPAVTRGALLGLVGVLLGAGVWAVLGAFFGIQHVLVAVVAGALIAVLARLGARRPTKSLQIIVALEALGTVVLGELLWVMIAPLRESQPALGLQDAAQLYRQNLGAWGEDVAFALLGAVFGAFAAVGILGGSIAPPHPRRPGAGAGTVS